MSGRKMKVVMHADGTSIRGNERQVILLATELARRGHDVLVSCRAKGELRGALEAAGIRTTGIRPGGDADVWNAARFTAMLRRERPDAVLLTSWIRALVAGWAAHAAGVPRVILRLGTIHGFEGPIEAWKYRHALTRYHHAVICNSRVVADALREQVPALTPDRVPVIVNGIHVDPPPPPAPVRRDLHLPDDAILLAGVAGLERNKGFDLLIPAMAKLDGRVHAAIAGEGSQRDALIQQAREMGVADRVHLLGQRRDVPAVLAAADAFVLPSRREGMSVAMLEAISARRPVVAAEVGGVWEALAPREGRPAGGWIVPPRDADALAAALAEVVGLLRTDPAAVRARADEAAWRLENWLTVPRMMDRYEAVLRGDAPPPG